MFTKDNLNNYLSALGKEFRKLNGTKMSAEIILVGGAAILANYGFREMTYDVDAIISASSVMEDAINRVGDQMGLPFNWLKSDFKVTNSYSHKLSAVSIPYQVFSNILNVRTVSAEYLVAMKLMSGRRYRSDLSDILGILWEHEKNNNPLTLKIIDEAVILLYESWNQIPEETREFINAAFTNGNYEKLFLYNRKSEEEIKEILTDNNKAYPDKVKEESSEEILKKLRR